MTVDQRVRLQIGELVVQNLALMTQVEELQAKIAELEKPRPAPTAE